MRIYDRLVAGWGWLRKFTIWSPYNFQEDYKRDSVQPWGNYSVGANIYPNLFEIFVKYSPTASALVNRKVKFIVGNIDKELKRKRTTNETTYTNSVITLLENLCHDYVMFQGSFAIWVGFDDSGAINEFKQISLENIRYIKRDPDIYPYTDDRFMIGVMGESGEIADVYYPYQLNRIKEQLENYEESLINDIRMREGQILFYNNSSSAIYPDCVFDSLVPLLLTDAGTDTMVMSILGNSDIGKTYMKRYGTKGADVVGSMGRHLLSVWELEGSTNAGAIMPEEGSEFYQTGVKSAGQKEYIDIPTEESIQNYVKVQEFPKFIDDTLKIDERTARKLCVTLEMPYEYFYKMDSGVINQQNRDAIIKELNVMYENDRETIEGVINDILENSVFEWRLSIKAIGEDKDELKEANDNITNN